MKLACGFGRRLCQLLAIVVSLLVVAVYIFLVIPRTKQTVIAELECIHNDDIALFVAMVATETMHGTVAQENSSGSGSLKRDVTRRSLVILVQDQKVTHGWINDQVRVSTLYPVNGGLYHATAKGDWFEVHQLLLNPIEYRIVNDYPTVLTELLEARKTDGTTQSQVDPGWQAIADKAIPINGRAELRLVDATIGSIAFRLEFQAVDPRRNGLSDKGILRFYGENNQLVFEMKAEQPE